MSRLRWVLTVVGAVLLAGAALAWWLVSRRKPQDAKAIAANLGARLEAAASVRDIRVAIARTEDAALKARLASAMQPTDPQKRAKELADLAHEVGL